MNMITVTAKTLDEAITKALIELGTTSDNMDYEIVEKGSSGIFGLFGKNVVIRAKKKREDDDLEAFLTTGKIDVESKEPAKAVSKEQPKEASKENAKETSKETPKETSKRNSQKGQKNQQKNQQKAQKEEAASETKEEPRQQARKSSKQKPPKPVQEKPADNKPSQQEKQTLKADGDPAKSSREDSCESEEKKAARKIDAEACRKAAKEFLEQVFRAMGIEVAISTDFDDKEKEMTVDLSGPDMGILIGKRGQTLDSLQYLTSLVVNKQCDGYVRVKLDTENYRERRKETLETLARNIAYKVKRTRRSVSLEPMNPYERRIIHAALQNDRYVVTRSEGEDPFRHVVISLKREGRDRREGKKSQGQNQAKAENQNQAQE